MAAGWQRCAWRWFRILRFSRRAPRRLRLCESLPLGERRFVAVVEFERSRFLLGGTSASLVLLAAWRRRLFLRRKSCARPSNQSKCQKNFPGRLRRVEPLEQTIVDRAVAHAAAFACRHGLGQGPAASPVRAQLERAGGS